MPGRELELTVTVTPVTVDSAQTAWAAAGWVPGTITPPECTGYERNLDCAVARSVTAALPDSETVTCAPETGQVFASREDARRCRMPIGTFVLPPVARDAIRALDQGADRRVGGFTFTLRVIYF